jgi:Mn-dependent DtxR family transcriptional regulator
MSGGISRRDYDCIESVQSLTSTGWPARVKDVAARMKVAPPTAVEFLDKLVAKALVEKGPSGYKLSPDGIAFLKEATRVHRLLETLLARTGMSLDEACRIASSVGTDVDAAAVEKLCAHLSHPGSCPHGMPIPGGDKYD